MDFAQKLRNLREDMEPPTNQTELGEILNMNQMKISRLERGETEPSLQDLFDICTLFHISADYLLGLIDEPLPYKK
ncbi:MAG: helix-turn-helix domain-containing protein [Oscillospiraceae bacterium]|nr:helix-turn-helix domain-containing protein [Oscillospiraceae bacterium]